MSRLLYALFCVSLSYAFQPPEISVDNIGIKYDDRTSAHYIEIEENKVLEIKCNHHSGEEVGIKINDETLLTDIAGYDESDRKSRTSISDDDYTKIYRISNIQLSDSGLYDCYRAQDPTLLSSIYVFVKNAKKFIPLRVPDGVNGDENELDVPCRTTHFVDNNNVKLYANGEPVKDAHKHYDPRFGFEVPIKIVPMFKQETKFTCEVEEEKADFVITPKKSGGNHNDMTLVFDKGSKWHHVGGKLNISCVMTNKRMKEIDMFKYVLTINCPRCGDTTAVKYSVVRPTISSRSLVGKLTIDSLTMEDTGNYNCSVALNGGFVSSITEPIDVSPHRGQIAVIDRQTQDVTVDQGQPFQLFVNMSIYPEDRADYKVRWVRYHLKPLSKDNESAPIVNGEFYKLDSVIHPDVVNEKLTVPKAKLDMSGIYTMTIEFDDFTRTFEWSVKVLTKLIQPRIEINHPNVFALMDQAIYQYGINVRITCIVPGLPPAIVTMTKRKMNSLSRTNFQPLPSDQYETIQGTYENGLVWNTTLDDNFELQCEASRGSDDQRVNKAVIVASKAAYTEVVTEPSKNAKRNEQKDNIYEGDDVRFQCYIYKTFSAEWKKGDMSLPSQPLVDPADSTPGQPYLVETRLYNVTSADNGNYTCFGRFAGKAQQKISQQTITVVTTSKPIDQSVMNSAEFQYGQVNARLECKMEGMPPPLYKWYHNDQLVQGAFHKDFVFQQQVSEYDAGEYRCVGYNRAGEAEHLFGVKVTGTPARFGWAVLALVLLLSLCAIFTLAYFYWRQKKKSAMQRQQLQAVYQQLIEASNGNDANPLVATPKGLSIDQRINQLAYNRNYEIKRENLEISEQHPLGHGQFGRVMMGWLMKPRRPGEAPEQSRLAVAVKAPRDGRNPTQQKMLADELKIMSNIGKHPNVLSLVGAVTKNMQNGELYVVVEMCELSNLKDYLRKNQSGFINELRSGPESEGGYLQPNKTRYAAEEIGGTWSEEAEKARLLPDSTVLATSDLLAFAVQIANGMEYLSSLPCIHRDLAARNVLLTRNKICRIADFGMARDSKDYYRMKKSKDDPLPVRWMPPEAIDQQVFTIESDVWAFGIVLYEIFTLGGDPYRGVQNGDLYDHLMEGNRCKKPINAHEDLYSLMLRCWELDPLERPSFDACLNFLKDHLKRASPDLLERLEGELIGETMRQTALSSWVTQDSDPQVLGRATMPHPNSPTESRYILSPR